MNVTFFSSYTFNAAGGKNKIKYGPSKWNGSNWAYIICASHSLKLKYYIGFKPASVLCGD